MKLAQAVHLTFQQIQKYERGYNRISAGKLYELAKVLGTEIQYFFDGFREKKVTPLSEFIDYTEKRT